VGFFWLLLVIFCSVLFWFLPHRENYIGPKFHLFNTLDNLEITTLTLICNHTFTFLKYPMTRGPDLAAAVYSTQKSSVLPLYEVSSYLDLCVTK